MRSSPFALREHPFSIASPPEQLPRLEFTIKALGDFTRTIEDTKPGETAYLDGPYRVFTPRRWSDAAGFVFIAGGVGITPIMSMLRSLAARADQRPLHLFYGNRTLADVLFRDEIEQLAGRLDLTVVHVLQEPPEDWTGERGFITREILDRHLPERGREQVGCFLCGPPPLTAAAERDLQALGVPRNRIEHEIFDLT